MVRGGIWTVYVVRGNYKHYYNTDDEFYYFSQARRFIATAWNDLCGAQVASTNIQLSANWETISQVIGPSTTKQPAPSVLRELIDVVNDYTVL